MRYLLTITGLLLFLPFLQAQEKETPGFKRFLASISVGTAPLPDRQATFLPGAEVYITPRFSVYNEVALQTSKSNFDSSAQNKKYFRYKGELRYYLSADDKKVKPYFAAQYTTASRSFDVLNGDRYYNEAEGDDSAYYYSTASINSPVQTMTVQFGLALNVFDDFWLDLAAGGGTRITNTTYTNVTGLYKTSEFLTLNKELASTYRYIGRHTRSQLNLNFRISYRF